MRNTTSGRLLATIIAALLPAQMLAQDLQNGDFELPGTPDSPPAGWTIAKGTFICDAGRHKSGKFSGKIDGGDRDSAVYQDVPVTAGMNYVLTGVWRNGDKTAPFDVARATIKWLSAPGGDEIAEAANVNSGSVVSEWTPFKVGPVTAPAGVAAARIRLAATFNTAGFDSLKWEPTSEPPVSSTSPAIATAEVKSGVVTPAVSINDMPAMPGPRGEKQSAAAAAMPSFPSASASPAGGESLVWVRDLATGYSAAAQNQRKVLLFFAGDSDKSSQQLNDNIFSDPEIQTLVASEFVPIRLGLPASQDIADKLQIKKPGTVILYSSDGRALDMLNGDATKADFLKALKK